MASPPLPSAAIIPLPRGAATWPAGARGAWETIEAALHRGLQGWAEAADDALFQRSEKGEGSEVFFDGLRILRRQRAHMEQAFWAHLRRGTERWVSRGPETPAPITGPSALTLLGHEELEEGLAVQAMAERAYRDAGPQWAALADRLGHLLQRPSAPLPFAPAEVAETFRQVLDELDELQTPVRLVLLKLFERQAWPELAHAVQAANDQLRAAGVLPNLAATAVRVTRAASAAPEAPRGTLGAVSAAGPVATHTGIPDNHPVSAPSTAVLLQALARLRPALGEALTAPQSSPGTMREALLARLPEDLRHGSHERAIDLVAVVFDFLLRDAVMPTPIQALLGRLQLPYLRVAVLDPHGFAQAHHPARQLLDVLADMGKTWSEADDPRHDRFDAMRATVERLAEAPDTDLEIFTAERTAWQARLSREAPRQTRTEQRVVEAQAGQERKTQAQKEVATALVQKLGQVAVPLPLRALLFQQWSAVMMLYWLREGPTSQAYRRAVFLLDQIRAAHQAQPHTRAADCIERMRPSLRATLDQGWVLLGLDGKAAQELTARVDAFLATHTGAPIDPAPAPVPPLAPNPLALPVATVREIQQAAQAAQEAPVAVTPDPVAAPSETPAPLPVGTWLAFEVDGVAHRGKVSWISPFSGRWLMVSAQGLKVAELTPHEVARQLETGQAQILPSQTLVSRALAAQTSVP
jgi:hypothetical protein